MEKIANHTNLYDATFEATCKLIKTSNLHENLLPYSDQTNKLMTVMAIDDSLRNYTFQEKYAGEREDLLLENALYGTHLLTDMIKTAKNPFSDSVADKAKTIRDSAGFGAGGEKSGIFSGLADKVKGAFTGPSLSDKLTKSIGGYKDNAASGNIRPSSQGTKG